MRQKPDLLLKYYREVTKSKHLHFGCWEEGEELDIKHLLIAQERYLDHLMAFIPDDVRTVLDVGCGVGGNAMRLKEKGCDVTSVSPDPYQKVEFRKNTGGKIPFVLSKFEALKLDKKFDLVLMAESVQYIDTVDGFRKCREVLRNGGYLLASDYFREEGIDDEGIMFAGRSHQHYLSQAKLHGLTLIKSDDITLRVAPTVDFMSSLTHTYVIPSFKLVAYALEIYIPFLYKIVRLLFRRTLKRVLDKSLIDAATFAKYRKYMVYLFQLNLDSV